MKIDYLISFRDKYRQNYIDSEKFLILKQNYDDFFSNSFLRNLFYQVFRYYDYKEIYDQYINFNRYVETWNNEFLKKKRKSLSNFFENLGDIKLNEQQQNIVATDEKALMVLAGAGSGKTLTIAVKVKYLVEVCKVKPEKILLLAFTRKSASEMTDRIKNKLGVNVHASTFHSLGYKIISDTDEKKLEVPVNSEKIYNDFFANCVKQNNKLTNIIKEYTTFYDFKVTNESKWLSKLVYTFVNLLKSRRSKISDIRKINLNNPHFTKKDKLFLIIAEEAQNYYEKELVKNKLTDFNDMIIRAAEYVEAGKWKPDFTHVIIDEYQDISFSRYRLVHAIIKASNASLMCIGDDWQSIYRFTGSDVDLIANFQKYWGRFKRMRVERNYRNTQENIDASAGFVLRNPRQLSKKLVSDRHEKYPFKAVFYGSPSNGQAATPIEAVIKILKEIYSIEGSKLVNILLLGRNNADLYFLSKDGKFQSGFKCEIKNDDTILKNDGYPNLLMRFLTVHRAKGLEADYVVILNMKSGMIGFPNQIVDDSVMRFVLAEPDDFEYAEERRLFYVALTRSRNTTYLLIPDRQPSVFAKELLNIGI